MNEISQLLKEYRNGNRACLDELLPLVYHELRRLAHIFLKSERQNLTLQRTALVHDTYLKLIDQHSVSTENRARFFALSATAMPRILLDNARRHTAEKRRSGMKVFLEDIGEVAINAIDANEDLIELALGELEEFDPPTGKDHRTQIFQRFDDRGNRRSLKDFAVDRHKGTVDGAGVVL